MKRMCMFCEQKGEFNIHNEGKNRHTIKSDIIEFFGYKIEDHLRPEDVVCKKCMYIMESIAKLKRCLYPLIYRNDNGCARRINYDKRWDGFTSFNSIEETDSPLSHNDLVVLRKSEPYKDDDREVRSKSRTSITDHEVARTFSRVSRTSSRGKRRKRKREIWTRNKNKGRYSSSSTIREYRTPSPGPSLRDDSDSSSPEPSLRDDSDSSDEPLQAAIPVKIYTCCNNYYDFEKLNKHKIEVHKLVPRYWCNFCPETYVDKACLNEHQSTHIDYECYICGEFFTHESELRIHHQYHVENSITCRVCNKKYLNKKELIKHRINAHMTRNVPSRIDFPEKQENNNAICKTPLLNNGRQSQEFEAKIILQEVDNQENQLED